MRLMPTRWPCSRMTSGAWYWPGGACGRRLTEEIARWRRSRLVRICTCLTKARLAERSYCAEPETVLLSGQPHITSLRAVCDEHQSRAAFLFGVNRNAVCLY